MKIYIFLIYVFIIKSKDILEDDKNSSPNLAVFNLKLYHNTAENIDNIFSSIDYLDKIHSSLPYLEVEVGKSIKDGITITEEIEERIKNKKQFLSIFLELDGFSFYIDDNYFMNNQKKLICKYSSELSSSYEIKNDIESKYRNSIYASDFFKIYSDISLNKYDLIKLIFRHSFSLNKNISYICGKAGLLYNSEKQDEYSQLNFIHQIHSNLKNVDYSFMFKFKENKIEEENENGLLIIGSESYIKNDKKFELYSFYTKSKNTMARQEWRFDVESLKIGDKNIELKENEFVFKLDIEGIEIPSTFQEILDEYFFNNYYTKNICVKEELYLYYIVIYCHTNNFTNNDINNFPKIQFSKKEIGFDFSFFGNELFYKKGNKYFFKLISIVETKTKEFKLGRMFLRKYNVIFNSDSKMMTFYKINEIKDRIEQRENSVTKSNALKILSYIFICLLFLVIGLYLGRKFCILRRKRYAMELDDNDYVYESNSNNYKDDKKLIQL